jgi:hypothetical protein
MGRNVFVLHSILSPNAVADALRRSIDKRKRQAKPMVDGFDAD